ncbi:MAG: hypothetical protein LBL90_01715 [Prevotellaceae bacterium]|nr:hypothetical protein [Prevotellaceae bacterium]
MRGYGSLLYALKHTGMFAACCPLSAAVFTDDEIMAMSSEGYYFTDLFGKGEGKEHLADH